MNVTNVITNTKEKNTLTNTGSPYMNMRSRSVTRVTIELHIKQSYRTQTVKA